MFRALVVVLFVASPALAESRDEYMLRKTLESLQGDWGVKQMFVAGKPAATGGRFTFRDDVFVKSTEPEESARMLFDLSGPVPKIEYTDRHGVTMLGIMGRTTTGNVVMCLVEAGNEPPKTFASTTDNAAVLIELARPRP
jgi:hypothetical protein